MILGFKALFLDIPDGRSQMLLDFSLVGEEGKKKNYGLKQKQLEARFSKEHSDESHTAKCIKEYDQSKIALMMEMIRRVIKHKIHFDYILADSWFACAGIIKFVTSDYETIGGLFKDVMADSVQLTFTEKIWDMMVELVREMAQCFNIGDEQILDMLVNRSDKLRHFIESYQFKFAS